MVLPEMELTLREGAHLVASWLDASLDIQATPDDRVI